MCLSMASLQTGIHIKKREIKYMQMFGVAHHRNSNCQDLICYWKIRQIKTQQSVLQYVAKHKTW